MSSAIKIGWSEISITPDKKASLTGQFAERISQYVEKLASYAIIILKNCEIHEEA